MNDLKMLLFEETKHERERYEITKREHGEFDIFTACIYTRFFALYNLIEDAGLEEEYQDWKQHQN